MSRKMQRTLVAMIIVVIAGISSVLSAHHQPTSNANTTPQTTNSSQSPAASALAKLTVKGRAPMTGYSRDKFSNSWEDVGDCDMREHILGRDLTNVKLRSSADCTVLSGTLQDPYTGKTIQFVRGPGTSTKVQIDHVVAIGDAWQKGAQMLTAAQRKQLYNDPLELLAVDGPANEQKGDGDAATWLPPNKAYRCRYVARQIAVKAKYHLWVTAAERDAMQRVLNTCPDQTLPTTS